MHDGCLVQRRCQRTHDCREDVSCTNLKGCKPTANLLSVSICRLGPAAENPAPGTCSTSRSDKILAQRDAWSSHPIFQKFPLHRRYSHLSDASHVFAFTPRTSATTDYSWGNLLTVSQPANSKYTPTQLAWLREKFLEFLHHQVNKTTSQFFPALYEEYFLKWPPTPGKEEISEAGGKVEVATAAARQIEEHVCDFGLAMLVCSELTMITINSGSTVGCITALARSMVSGARVALTGDKGSLTW